MELVQIGKHQLPVVPQRHARLRRKLSAEDFASLMSAEYSHEAYRILGVLIPELPGLIPEHEWDGFASREEWQQWKDTGEDPRPDTKADEEDNLAPTTAEVINAFEVAFQVSGAGRMGKIVDLILTTNRMAQGQNARPTQSSLASPGSNGE